MRVGAPLSCALALVAACYDLGGFTGGPEPGDAGTDANANTSTDAAAPSDAAEGDAAPSPTAYQAAVLADAPVGFWPLGDHGPNAADLGPHALTGTYGATVAQGAPAVLPSEPSAATASFPGTIDAASVIRIARTPLLEPSGAVSVECWLVMSVVKPSELVSYGPQTATPYQPWVLQMQASAFELYTAKIGDLRGATVPTAGARYHVVGTYDGATHRIYVNGVLDGSKPTGGALNDYDGMTGLSIGGGWNGEVPFKGSIADVAVYDHALAADRVAAHYMAGITPP